MVKSFDSISFFYNLAGENATGNANFQICIFSFEVGMGNVISDQTFNIANLLFDQL